MLGGLLLLTACAGPTQGVASEDAKPLMGEAWFEARAQTLKISAEAAKARDAALPETEPPENFWDAQTAKQAAVLWRDLCATCHGINGNLEGVPQEKPLPRKWGSTGVAMGFFFGGDKMRAGIYKRIAKGGDKEGKPSRMPPWGDQLSREQIWALVYHIEGF